MNHPPLRVLKAFPTSHGAIVLPVHYSHDPEKTLEWAATQRATYLRPEDWDREMEIDFSLAIGTSAYPDFRSKVHVYDDEEIPYYDRLPLILFCDFNTSPMAWGVGQVVGGWIHVIDEIFRDPSTIEEGVDEFRNLYPAHRAEVFVYGDATVKSFYDTMRLHFRGYVAPVTFKVPPANPKVKDRVNAVNNKLGAKDGAPGVKIRKRCVQLIQDFAEVVWRPGQRDLLKVNDTKNPYSKRTHQSDGFGYWVFREWPRVQIVGKVMKPRAERERPKRMLGDIHYRERSGRKP